MTTFLPRLRNRHFFALDLAALAVIPSLALALRLDGFEELPSYARALLVFSLIGLTVRLLIFWRAGLYGRYWRYASVDEDEPQATSQLPNQEPSLTKLEIGGIVN